MPEDQKSSFSEAVETGASAAHTIRGAIKTGKAISSAAKGAAAGGPYGAVAGAVWAGRKHIGKIIVAVIALLMLPVLFVLMLPGLIFGGLTNAFSPSDPEIPILNSETAIIENANEITFTLNGILGEALDDVLARIEADFAASGADHMEVKNAYSGGPIYNANLFISQYCAAKDKDFESISLNDLAATLRENKQHLYSYTSKQEIRESTVTDPASPVTDMADGSIEFDHVTFRYSDSSEKPVLDDINLKIRSGMTIGIVGGTGSAKSSLVQLVPRLYDVSSGSLKVGGVDVRDYDLEALRDQVSMVLQKNVLFSGTIAENLRWGNPNATDEEVRHAAQLAQADGFVQEFPDKYDTYIEQGGTNVSGGQRQRLCIARALLKKPKILILDDSTSAVDTKTDKLIRNAFHNEIPDTTKIIIAQRVASVEESDMILVMDNGRIMASGTHDELLATCDEYRSIYESQTKNQARPEELVAAEPAGAQSETEAKEGETR